MLYRDINIYIYQTTYMSDEKMSTPDNSEEKQINALNEDKLFAVIIATYKRSKDKSFEYLQRTAECLKKQTYKNYYVFLMCYDYIDKEEFYKASKLFDQDKIYAENFPISFREGYFNIRKNKWTCGGANARYNGIKKAMDEGYQFYVHLDDDDIWYENHLQILYEHIKKLPEADFYHTRAKYANNKYSGPFPAAKITEIKYNNLIPKSGGLVHSTTCHKLNTLGQPIKKLYENRLNEVDRIKKGKVSERNLEALDSLKWKMVANKIKKNNCKSLYIPIITCHKESDVNIP